MRLSLGKTNGWVMKGVLCWSVPKKLTSMLTGGVSKSWLPQQENTAPGASTGCWLNT